LYGYLAVIGDGYPIHASVRIYYSKTIGRIQTQVHQVQPTTSNLAETWLKLHRETGDRDPEEAAVHTTTQPAEEGRGSSEGFGE